jgi:hypothetical protein
MDNLKPTTDHLQQSLSQLHHQLVGTPRVDDASKRLLREVLGDIERLLDHGAAVSAVAPAIAAPAGATSPTAPSAPTADPAQALPRLEALAIEFDAEHPALSAGLREFIDLLGRAGL